MGLGLDFPEGLQLLTGTDIAPALILPNLPLKPTRCARREGLRCIGDCRLHPSRVQTGMGAGTPPRHTIPLNKRLLGDQEGKQGKLFPGINVGEGCQPALCQPEGTWAPRVMK